ncbi:hypothetical protein ACWCPI_12045 [Streptomyces sp. NPDC001920]
MQRTTHGSAPARLPLSDITDSTDSTPRITFSGTSVSLLSKLSDSVALIEPIRKEL